MYATLGLGAAALVLQLFLAHRFRRPADRAMLAGVASIAILICVLLLESGHQAQRMRSPKHESFEARLLRDGPAAVQYEPRTDLVEGRRALSRGVFGS